MSSMSVSLAADNQKAVGLFGTLERSRVGAGASEAWLMAEMGNNAQEVVNSRNLNLLLLILRQAVFAQQVVQRWPALIEGKAVKNQQVKTGCHMRDNPADTGASPVPLADRLALLNELHHCPLLNMRRASVPAGFCVVLLRWRVSAVLWLVSSEANALSPTQPSLQSLGNSKGDGLSPVGSVVTRNFSC